MINKVILVGNVGKDPEVRYFESSQAQGNGNQKVASFSLATSERYRDRNGELRENTEWHNIVAWRSLADLAEKYIKKGTQIYVEGRLRTRSWDAQDGKRYVTEIVADVIQLLGRKSDNPSAGEGPSSYSSPRQTSQSQYPHADNQGVSMNISVEPKPRYEEPLSGGDDSEGDLPF